MYLKNAIQFSESDIILYVYLINNIDLISCQNCFYVPRDKNKMYRIKSSNLYYCKECIDKWVDKFNNPISGNKLKIDDVEINYEINDLIEKYIKYNKLNIKNIKIDISINKNNNILFESKG